YTTLSDLLPEPALDDGDRPLVAARLEPAVGVAAGVFPVEHRRRGVQMYQRVDAVVVERPGLVIDPDRRAREPAGHGERERAERRVEPLAEIHDGVAEPQPRLAGERGDADLEGDSARIAPGNEELRPDWALRLERD